MAKLNELLVIIVMTEVHNLLFYLAVDFIKCFRWVTIGQMSYYWPQPKLGGCEVKKGARAEIQK